MIFDKSTLSHLLLVGRVKERDILPLAGAMEFVNGTDQSMEYTWNANGNMTRDLTRGIAAIGCAQVTLARKTSNKFV